MWPRLPNKAPIYTHFWGCGIAGTKSKQGLEPCATLVAHLHTEVSHSLGVQLSGKRRKTAYSLGFLAFGRVSRPLRQHPSKGPFTGAFCFGAMQRCAPNFIVRLPNCLRGKALSSDQPHSFLGQ
jgi:hypothetical protein